MRQTRGALKFLLAEYRAVLKNAMLAMALTASASVVANADNNVDVYVGDVMVDGSNALVGVSSNNVEIGKAGSAVTISNTGTGTGLADCGIGINATQDNTVTVLGKNIAISSDFRGIYAKSDSNKKHITKIGTYEDTDTLTITQNKDQGENAIAVFLKDSNGTMDLAAKKIEISSKGWYAVHAQHMHENTPDTDPTVLTLTADEINITNTNEIGAGISAYSGSTINVTGALTVDAPRAIEARGNSTININADGKHKTVLNGDIVLGTDSGTQAGSGSIIDAKLNINLATADSSWTGNLSTYYPNSGNVQKDVKNVKVTLANGATWNVTPVQSSSRDTTKVGSSDLALNNLTLNDATINIQDTDTEVKVDTLSGTGGTVNVAAKVDTKTGDDNTGSLELTTSKLTVGKVETTEGETTSLAVNLKGITSDDFGDTEMTEIANMANTAVSVTNNGKSVQKTTTIAEGDIRGEIVAKTTAAADAEVSKDEVTETIQKSEPAPEPKPEVTPKPEVKPEPEVTPEPNTVIVEKENTKHSALKAISAMNFMQWRHDMNDLNKRMGELRDSPAGVGVWARAYGSEHKYGSQNVTSKNNSIQIGSDYDVGHGWKVGGAFTYTDGDSTYNNGSADNKAYGFAVYGSWFADNGLFVDLIGKYSRMSTDFNLGNMSGDLHNDALSFSAEVGWNIPFAGIAFIEPQAELSYGVIFGDNDTTSNGVHIKQDDTKTLIGRAGFRTGLHFNENKGTVYARASVLHDFEGETKYFASNSETSATFKDDLGGTYYEFGLGANYKFTPNCYSYVDLERQTHGPIAEKWRWNVGVRYVF